MYCRVRPRNSARVALHVRRSEGDPVDYGVERGAFEGAGRGGRVVDIGGYGVDARGGELSGGVLAAGQKRQIDTALDGQSRASRADDSGAAYEKNSHVAVVADNALSSHNRLARTVRHYNHAEAWRRNRRWCGLIQDRSVYSEILPSRDSADSLIEHKLKSIVFLKEEPL